MIPALVIVAALASALLGGVFFAFSSFIMPALGRVPPAQGIRAMQRINVDVYHWSFMGTFLATPLLCLVLGYQAIVNWSVPGAPLVLLGAALHVFGCFVVTAAGNVPRNTWLATVDSDGVDDAAGAWRHYAVGWTRWNHVRTLACMASTLAFVLALLEHSGGLFER